MGWRPVILAAIQRPVAVTTAYIGIGLLGVAAMRNVPLELLPDVDLPQLTVEARWPGGSPEAVEAFVTAPLEGIVQQSPGVEKVVSTSEPGVATVEVRFRRRTNMELVRLELSERLMSARGDLPDGVVPTITPYLPPAIREQQRPFLEYTLTGPHTPEALRAYVRDVLAPELTQVVGVRAIEVRGGRDRLLEIALEPRSVEAFGLDAQAVQQRILGMDHVRAAGVVNTEGGSRTVVVRSGVASLSELLALPVDVSRGGIVRLGDVAVVHDAFDDPRQLYRIDGLPAVSFTVHRAVGTNVLTVSDAVKARLDDVASSRPPGVRLILDADESAAVRAQLSDLGRRALVAAAVIFVVLLLFLRTVRAAVVVFATIGFSILLTVNLTYLGGLTLNVLTLMGIAVGFGLIVDNAIVVIENIHRLRRRGAGPLVAAHRGARQVLLPIMAGTLTTVIALLPFVYLQGELRVYYLPLAVVVSLSLVASLLTAFTFVPAFVHRAGDCRGERRGERRTDQVPRRAEPPRRAAAALVRAVLRRPVPTVLVAVALLGVSCHAFDQYVTRDVLPSVWSEGDGHLDIHISAPRGESLEQVDALTRHFEERIRAMPEVERVVTRVNPSFSRTRVTFPDSLAATARPAAIKEQLTAYSHRFDGLDVRVFGYGPSFYGVGGSAPGYTLEVFGYDYRKVREIATGLGDRLRRFSRIRDVDTNSGGRFLREQEVEVVLVLDRRRLAAHGLRARDIVGEVVAATRLGARDAALRLAAEEIQLAVVLAGGRQMDVHQLEAMVVGSSTGAPVRLGDVARLGERTVPARIEREDQRYRRAVTYEFVGPTALGDAVRDSVIASTHLPPGYSIGTGDDWRWNAGDRRQLQGVLILSVLLVFMLTAALFESLRLPFTVLLTVPMAFVGICLIFAVTGAAFTREAYVGAIMAGGIVVNNAILLVHHINQLRRDAGLALEDAALRGTLERARPIVMTTTTTLLGLLPLVSFSGDSGASVWDPIGYALIGGLTSSTAMVLTVTPALYLLLERAAEPG